MRIVVDGSSLCYPLTGIGYYTHSLIGALADERPSWEITILTPYSPTSPVIRPNVFHDLKASNAHAQHSRGWRDWWFESVLPSATHTLGGDLFWAINGLVPFTLSDIPVALTIYDFVPERYPETMSWLPRHYRKWNLRYWLKRAAILLPISEATRDEAEELFGVTDMSVVYPGVDDIFLPSQQILGLESEMAFGDYLVVIGTLEPRKNLEHLVGSVEDLLDRHIWPAGLVLRIVGGQGWQDGELLKRISRLEASGIAHCHGYVARESLPAILAGARAILMPSLYEGFGMPLAEAMAVGCPILCSDIPPFREVVRGYPALLHGTDQASMTEAYRIFLTSPRGDFLPVTQKTDQHRFTWQKSAHQVAKAFENYSKHLRRQQ